MRDYIKEFHEGENPFKIRQLRSYRSELFRPIGETVAIRQKKVLKY